MTRETLESILEKAPGVSRKDGTFGIAAEHRAALYLVAQGHTSLVQDVVSIRIDGDIVQIDTRDHTLHYLPLALIQGFSIRPPRETSSGRTGF